MKSRALAQVAIFTSLPADEIDHLAATLEEREFPAGAMIITEGDSAECLFIVVEGEAEIIMAFGTLNERMVGLCAAGSFLGEMGLVNPGSRRTASVRARTPTRMLEMTRADFDGLLNRQPKLALEVLRILSMRLDQAQNRTIRDLEAKNKQLSDAYVQLRVAQRQLVEKEKMERELELARAIQLSMVPRQRPKLDGYDFGARMVSARAVGGDFFDFIPLSPTSIGIAIGDVSDKGVPAALFMALTSNLLRAEAKRLGTPGDTLRKVHSQLMEINDAGMFVTVFYGVLDGATRQLRYARAGHELPIILNDQGKLITLPEAPGLPLGATDDVLLDEQIVDLPAGATILFYTDGVTDGLDPGGIAFGLAKLSEALLERRSESAQNLCEALLQVCEQHRADAPQYDDITVVTVQTAK
jgi:sigma-B regulation protein RsbU (phosphoserine phosphatase)